MKEYLYVKNIFACSNILPACNNIYIERDSFRSTALTELVQNKTTKKIFIILAMT